MQIAAMNPKWITKEEVPAEELEKERVIVRNQALNEGKPEKVVDRIVDGRMSKFFSDNCLLEQSFVKDDSVTIDALLKSKIAKIGEKISIRRFARFEMGEGLQKKEENFAEEVMKQIKN
jgi:elongation factor Ts